MRKFLLTFLLLITSYASITAQKKENFQYKTRPQEFENFEYRNDSIFSKKKVNVNARISALQKTVYPIIFIHGLNSSSDTWQSFTNYLDTQYGYTYGGRFDFCLNADNNNSKANLNFYPTSGADITAFESTLINGDYYLVNFNVKVNGSFGTDVLSHQSAIAKQGKALKKAIERVLQLTGKDKVILVGHSMGGLCSREYLQNVINWQPDNKHHVAKLVMVGVPNGGSNSSDTGLGFFVEVDTKSEAIRDLKTTYYYSGDAGRFLFGGIEKNDSNNMNEHLFGADFYNYDVNCNGAIGDNIIGLNSKSIDNNIDFSAVIGKVNGSETDGVVTTSSANLNTIYTTLQYPTKLFYYTASGIEIHTSLTSQNSQILQGLDEPNFKELAYEINLNEQYTGYVTQQEVSANADNDFFKIIFTNPILAKVSVQNISTSNMNATLLDATGNPVGNTVSKTGSSIDFSRNVNAGTYFLKISSSTPNTTDFQNPYTFSVSQDSFLGASTLTSSGVNFYPNPVKDILYIRNSTYQKASVYDELGRIVKTFDSNNSKKLNQIDISSLSKGNYIIILQNNQESKSIQVIKE